MASPLVKTHIRAESRLRDLTRQAVERIWRGLPGYDESDVPQWLGQVVPLVLSAQRTSVALTDGFLARALRRPPLGVNVDELIGAATRNGSLPEEAYRRPFVTLWRDLGEGKLFDDASSAALARAQGMAAFDVQSSMRATANAVQQADDGIFGYTRVADAGACLFCVEVDGAYVKSADAMPLHNGCGCGLEPLTAPHSRAAKLPSGVAVRQHGELGPVLTDSAHDFTTESEALG